MTTISLLALLFQCSLMLCIEIRQFSLIPFFISPNVSSPKTALADIHMLTSHLVRVHEIAQVKPILIWLILSIYLLCIIVICISGQKFALMEEKSVLASIFRKFQVKAIDKEEDLFLLGELILRPRDGIRVQLIPKFK